MNGKKNLTMYLGLGISLFGVILYDPLGLLFRGTGLIVIALGLVCMFFGYRQLNEVEMVNKTVESFEKNRERL
tara:strand:- start:1398 stop:1616 length:219 start_codon:yes stop_codon:yes gene_type:complete